MGYDLSSGDRDFSMQELANIVGKNAVTVESMIRSFADMAKRQDAMGQKQERMDQKLDEVLTRIDNVENKEEITEEQKDLLKQLVGRKVVEVLGLPLDVARYKWTSEQKAYFNLYSNVFYGALYTEVRAKGHLAGRLGATKKCDYKPAISDIENWYPSCGVETLKRKAEENRIAKLDADKMALKRIGRSGEQ